VGSGSVRDAAEALNLPVIVREAALDDIREAVVWDERQSPGLGGEFVRCLDVCLSLIGRNPGIFEVVHRQARMALVRRFPYLVIYRITPDFISVIAVMQGSRQPRRWKGRTGA